MDMHECRRTTGLSAEKKILFTFGDILERKGFQHLIDAMKILSDKRNDILCVISGKGRYKSSLITKIKRLDLEDTVILLDYIPTEKMPVWINSADMFVFPSLQESFGIVQVEALACGKPVIAARNAGSIEVIASNDVGILCEPGSGAALAEAIACGLERSWDPAKILKYAQQYRWDTIAGDLVRIYTTVLAEKLKAQGT
jgi:glycosyltransferase involved in cell wall biosynthesis